MKPTPRSDIPEEVLEYNRERYKSELAQGIFEMMERHGLNQTELAALLGVDKSRITHMLAAGDQNFEAETVADIFLVLGRASHLTLGIDIGKTRMPKDEGAAATTGKVAGREVQVASGNTIESHYAEITEEIIAEDIDFGSWGHDSEDSTEVAGVECSH